MVILEMFTVVLKCWALMLGGRKRRMKNGRPLMTAHASLGYYPALFFMRYSFWAALCCASLFLVQRVDSKVCQHRELHLESPATVRLGLPMECTALLLNRTGVKGDLLVTQLARAIEGGAPRGLQVNLVSNGITAEGLQSLNRIIQMMPTAISRLLLDHNPAIGDEGATGLAEALLSKDAEVAWVPQRRCRADTLVSLFMFCSNSGSFRSGASPSGTAGWATKACGPSPPSLVSPLSDGSTCGTTSSLSPVLA